MTSTRLPSACMARLTGAALMNCGRAPTTVRTFRRLISDAAILKEKDRCCSRILSAVQSLVATRYRTAGESHPTLKAR
jgi:hypothetical protein